MPISSDPFSAFEVHVLGKLRSSIAVSNLISNPEENIRGFASTVDDRRDVSTEADLPEILQLATLVTPQMSFTSSAVGILATYDLMVNSGSWNLSTKFNPLRWALICAFTDMLFSNEVHNISWNDKKFVTDMDFLGGSVGLSDVSENRGIEGWSAVFSFTATMTLNRADVIAFNQGTIT